MVPILPNISIPSKQETKRKTVRLQKKASPPRPPPRPPPAPPPPQIDVCWIEPFSLQSLLCDHIASQLIWLWYQRERYSHKMQSLLAHINRDVSTSYLKVENTCMGKLSWCHTLPQWGTLTEARFTEASSVISCAWFPALLRPKRAQDWLRHERLRSCLTEAWTWICMGMIIMVWATILKKNLVSLIRPNRRMRVIFDDTVLVRLCT